ncbi:MAG: hypothetical protein GY870_10375 [archaeon]|nr:hypothetical protein [archaeon]
MIFDVAEELMKKTIGREILIGFEYVIGGFFIFYIIQFFGYTFNKYRKKEPYKMQIAWALFFFGQFFMSLMNVFADFYYIDIIERMPRVYLNNVANAFGLLGLVAISFQIEKILRDHYINSIIITLIAACAIIFDLPPNFLTIFQICAYASTLGMIYAAVHSRVEDVKHLRQMLNIFIVGFVMLFLGNFLKSDIFLQYILDLLFIIRIIGDFLVIFSIFVLRHSFREFPSIMDLNWQHYLLDIHILSTNGVEIYNKSFVKRTETMKIDPDLAAAALTGVGQIMKEITGSKKSLNLIDQGDIQVMLEKSDKCIISLVVTEPLRIYEFKLDNLMANIIEIYGPELSNWSGDLTVFKDLDILIDKNFNLEGFSSRKVEKVEKIKKGKIAKIAKILYKKAD